MMHDAGCFVIPAEAGIQVFISKKRRDWIPGKDLVYLAEAHGQ
jgi:hypothetical protein